MLGVLVIVAYARSAAADTTVIDLDKDDEAAAHLAEAAGACAKGQPAFIATWCRAKTPRKARFAKRIDVTASEATPGILKVTVPVTDYGKGLVLAIVQPPIYCDAQACLPPDSLAAFIRTKDNVTAGDVRALGVTFDVEGMWKVRQWWGPKVTQVEIKLLDAGGKQLGEGTLLVPTR